MEKARRVGIKNILAYRLNVEQHMRFLTNKKAYVAYIEYWNSKLKNKRVRSKAPEKAGNNPKTDCNNDGA